MLPLSFCSGPVCKCTMWCEAKSRNVSSVIPQARNKTLIPSDFTENKMKRPISDKSVSTLYPCNNAKDYLINYIDRTVLYLGAFISLKLRKHSYRHQLIDQKQPCVIFYWVGSFACTFPMYANLFFLLLVSNKC